MIGSRSPPVWFSISTTGTGAVASSVAFIRSIGFWIRNTARSARLRPSSSWTISASAICRMKGPADSTASSVSPMRHHPGRASRGPYSDRGWSRGSRLDVAWPAGLSPCRLQQRSLVAVRPGRQRPPLPACQRRIGRRVGGRRHLAHASRLGRPDPADRVARGPRAGAPSWPKRPCSGPMPTLPCSATSASCSATAGAA